MPRTMSLRGRRAGALAGALCVAATISATPGAAQTIAPEPGAAATARPAAADLERIRLRTNVLAGRAATVRGVVRPALAGQRVIVQRRSGEGWHDGRPHGDHPRRALRPALAPAAGRAARSCACAFAASASARRAGSSGA